MDVSRNLKRPRSPITIDLTQEENNGPIIIDLTKDDTLSLNHSNHSSDSQGPKQLKQFCYAADDEEEDEDDDEELTNIEKSQRGNIF